MEDKSRLSQTLRNGNRVLNHLDLVRAALETHEVSAFDGLGVLEFHPTDVCDLECFYCTYRQSTGRQWRRDRVFPFDQLPLIAELRPRGIVLVGGGEPTVYQDGGLRFSDLVTSLRDALPETRLGLATNGAFFPGNDAAEAMDWVRVSIDAAHRRTFQRMKDGRLDSRIEHVLRYLQSAGTQVGVGFLYSRFNVDEMVDLIHLLYQSIDERLGPQVLTRVNVQFRAMCPIASCDCPSELYAKAGIINTPDKKRWWKNTIKELQAAVDTVSVGSTFAEFVRENTNLLDIPVEGEIQSIPSFNRCYTSLIRWILRPNGQIFPCVMKTVNSGRTIGNLLQDSVQSIWTNAQAYARLRDDWCRGPDECCRLYGVHNERIGVSLNKWSGQPISLDPFF